MSTRGCGVRRAAVTGRQPSGASDFSSEPFTSKRIHYHIEKSCNECDLDQPRRCNHADRSDGRGVFRRPMADPRCRASAQRGTRTARRGHRASCSLSALCRRPTFVERTTVWLACRRATSVLSSTDPGDATLWQPSGRVCVSYARRLWKILYACGKHNGMHCARATLTLIVQTHDNRDIRRSVPLRGLHGAAPSAGAAHARLARADRSGQPREAAAARRALLRLQLLRAELLGLQELLLLLQLLLH